MNRYAYVWIFLFVCFAMGCYKLESILLLCSVCVVTELNGLNQRKAMSVHRHGFCAEGYNVFEM